MYHTIESLANSLGVSSLVVQRRSVKLGIWTQQGISEENVHQLEFLRQAKVENVTSTQELTVEPAASENEVDSKLAWYGEFANGKPLYRRANEEPKSKGTVVSTQLWEFTDDSYVTPTYKERQATF